jgi:hypothetical protein
MNKHRAISISTRPQNDSENSFRINTKQPHINLHQEAAECRPQLLLTKRDSVVRKCRQLTWTSCHERAFCHFTKRVCFSFQVSRWMNNFLTLIIVVVFDRCSRWSELWLLARLSCNLFSARFECIRRLASAGLPGWSTYVTHDLFTELLFGTLHIYQWKTFLPSADYEVVAKGPKTTFCSPPQTLLKSVTKRPPMTHFVPNDICDNCDTSHKCDFHRHPAGISDATKRAWNVS